MVLPSEPEFEQALTELTQSLQVFLKANPEYQKALEIIQVPERVVQFRVVWEDDKGQPQVNRGFRVQVRHFVYLGVAKAKFTMNVRASSITLLLDHTRVVSVCTPPSSKYRVITTYIPLYSYIRLFVASLSLNSLVSSKPSKMPALGLPWEAERVDQISTRRENPTTKFAGSASLS